MHTPALYKLLQTQYTVIDDTGCSKSSEKEREGEEKNMQIAISFTRCIFILVATWNFVLSYLRFSMPHWITNTLKYLCINCCMNYSIAYWVFGSVWHAHFIASTKIWLRKTPELANALKKESNAILCNHYHHCRWLLTTVKLLSFEFCALFLPMFGYPANYFVYRFTP